MTTIMTYKNELTRLTLKKDPDTIMLVLKMKKEWANREGDCSVETKGVNKKKLIKMLSRFGDVFGTPIKIEVLKMGFNNMCHRNCINFCEICPEYKVQIGYNITSCDCGNFMCMEIHSVIKDTNDKLYDITADFNNETEKWFVPLNTNKNIFQLTGFCGRKYDNYITDASKCKCNTEWNVLAVPFVPTEFTNTIKMLNRVEIF